MRLWLAAAIGVVLGAAALAGVYYAARGLDRGLAQQLLESASDPAEQRPLLGRGTVEVYADGRWRRAEADFDLAEGVSRVSMQEGPLQVALLDDGSRLWRLETATKTAVALGPSERSLDWARVLSSYEPGLGPKQRVAGRLAQCVTLVSRRTRRVAAAVWVDVSTSQIVKRLTYDADGHLVAATELTSTEATPRLTREQLAIPRDWRRAQGGEDSARSISVSAFQTAAGFAPRLPAHVPRGCEFVGLFIRTCPHGCPYAELRYEDGLRVLAVYEHRPCGRGRGRGGCGRGQGQGRGCQAGTPDRQPVLIDQGPAKTVRHRRADLMVVVTGDLTAREILDVIRSIA